MSENKTFYFDFRSTFCVEWNDICFLTSLKNWKIPSWFETILFFSFQLTKRIHYSPVFYRLSVSWWMQVVKASTGLQSYSGHIYMSTHKPIKIAFEIAAAIKEKNPSLYLPLQVPLIIPTVSNWKRQWQEWLSLCLPSLPDFPVMF